MRRPTPAVAFSSLALAGALAVALVLGGCGAAAPSGGGHVAAAPPATLPARAVSYLPSTLKPLRSELLAREAGAPGLRQKLGVWGFVVGADRYFQGESHRLQLVDSRTLRFRTAAGADSYVTFTRGHLGSYLGSLPRIRRFETLERTGFLAVGQPCACHLANPAFLGVVSQGPTVTWLEINGPGATPRALASLIARAP